MSGALHRTPLFARHKALEATLVDFAGWEMPLRYKGGIIAEHLAIRTKAGLFDVSHMGRLAFRGAGALPFLRRMLTNDAARLAVGGSHYTILATETGGAIDDAYLYRFFEDEYLLVVNAAKSEADLAYLRVLARDADDIELADRTRELAMLALQGPLSEEILGGLVDDGALPEARRNSCSVASVAGARALVARTGYTGEPVCFELLVESDSAQRVWEALVDGGAEPAGLGARDTLRLEAGLPLYGHELGTDHSGMEIPIFACPPARHAVNLAASRGDFVGREALSRQHAALKRLRSKSEGAASRAPTRSFDRDARDGTEDALPRVIVALAVVGRSAPRAGERVVDGASGAHIGWVTSGAPVPYVLPNATGETRQGSSQHDRKPVTRPVALALVDAAIREGARVSIEARGKSRDAFVVPFHLRREGDRTVPVLYGSAK